MAVYTCDWCGKKYTGMGAGLFSPYCGKKCESEAKSGNYSSGITQATKKMHWKYFLICGWLIGIIAICCIIPIFIKGLVARAFGYW